MMPAFGEALREAQITQILVRVRSFCLNPDWPRGELNLPRALFTKKAYPEDEAVIETTLIIDVLGKKELHGGADTQWDIVP